MKPFLWVHLPQSSYEPSWGELWLSSFDELRRICHPLKKELDVVCFNVYKQTTPTFVGECSLAL